MHVCEFGSHGIREAAEIEIGQCKRITQVSTISHSPILYFWSVTLIELLCVNSTFNPECMKVVDTSMKTSQFLYWQLGIDYEVEFSRGSRTHTLGFPTCCRTPILSIWGYSSSTSSLSNFTKVAQNVSEEFFLQLYGHDWPMLENCTGWIITIRRPPFLLLEFELDRFSNMCELQLQSA